uniref:Uncharacterized protein n=1 Tax=Glossina pallidipes TaxID=7398 RepID=A0A1B0AEH7_GLOPL
MIRLPPTNKKVSFKIDVYKANERKIIVKAPRFFFARKVLITETTHATMHYMILIQDLEEPISTLRFDIEPIACVDKRFQITGKICVPWVRGFERYKHFSDKTLDKGIYVNVPIPTPTGYNTSVNPVCLELFLDPPCRYKIRLVGVSMPLSNVLTQMGPVLPLSFGIVFISIACASCSGIALALASIFYFVTVQ